jgi:excisionase family DNA binding protein
MADTTDFLLVEEVAAICRASPETVRFWIRTGRLHSIRPARRRLIARAEVNRFLAGKRPRRSANATKEDA